MRIVTLLALALLVGTAASTATAQTASVASQARAVRTLAYLESVAGETPDPITDVFVVNADGTGHRRVTHDHVDAASLEWSPDGRRFVFSTIPRGESSSIWVMNRDESNRRRLTPPGNWISPSWSRIQPSWSANGRNIFFSVTGAQPGLGIYVMNMDGTNPRRLTRKDDHILSWSPDQRRIAFVRRVLRNHQVLDRPELWVMDADGSGQRRLYSRLGHDDQLGLSPDWRKLAIDRERHAGSVHELYVMNVDGTGAQRFARASDDIRFSWSPSSRKIAFERDNGLSWGDAIWVAAPDGSKQRRLVSRGGNPLWSSDGRMVALASKDGISVISADGRARRVLVPWDGEITNIRWAPTSRK